MTFQLLSDGASEADGWFIDDVFVEQAPERSDFDRDGTSDILLQHTTSSWIGAWRMTAGGVPAEFLQIAFGDTQGWKPVGIADFNGDGINDLLLQHPSSQVGVWFLDVTGQPVAFRFLGGFMDSWKVVGVIDLDNNGIPDVLFQHPTQGVAFWRLGEFAQPITSGTLGSGAMNGWNVVTTGDVTGDGISDIIMQHTSSWVGAWQIDDSGRSAAFVPISFGDSDG